MSAFITVAYPRPSSGELKFDLNYYLDCHMPLVAKTWGPNGLKSWTVTEHARPVPLSQNARPYNHPPPPPPFPLKSTPRPP
ncbi:hypothetical protein SCUP515_05438 [Seiridium cupressi]